MSNLSFLNKIFLPKYLIPSQLSPTPKNYVFGGCLVVQSSYELFDSFSVRFMDRLVIVQSFHESFGGCPIIKEMGVEWLNGWGMGGEGLTIIK